MNTTDQLETITVRPVFVNLDDFRQEGIDTESDPLNILCCLEDQDNWNFKEYSPINPQPVV